MTDIETGPPDVATIKTGLDELITRHGAQRMGAILSAYLVTQAFGPQALDAVHPPVPAEELTDGERFWELLQTLKAALVATP